MTGEKRVHVETSCNFRYQDAGSFMLKKTTCLHCDSCRANGCDPRCSMVWHRRLECKIWNNMDARSEITMQGGGSPCADFGRDVTEGWWKPSIPPNPTTPRCNKRDQSPHLSSGNSGRRIPFHSMSPETDSIVTDWSHSWHGRIASAPGSLDSRRQGPCACVCVSEGPASLTNAQGAWISNSQL